MSTFHFLKTWPEYFQAIWDGRKKFEIRRNDRDFQIDDILVLEEWDNLTEKFTGRVIKAKVVYIVGGGKFGIDLGYVIMGIEVLSMEIKEVNYERCDI